MIQWRYEVHKFFLQLMCIHTYIYILIHNNNVCSVYFGLVNEIMGKVLKQVNSWFIIIDVCCTNANGLGNMCRTQARHMRFFISAEQWQNLIAQLSILIPLSRQDTYACSIITSYITIYMFEHNSRGWGQFRSSRLQMLIPWAIRNGRWRMCYLLGAIWQ